MTSTRLRPVFFFVNELTVWALLVACLRPGVRCHVLFVDPLFKPMGPVLDRLCAWLRGRGWVGAPYEEFEFLNKFAENHVYWFRTDIFRRCEPDFERWFDFAGIDAHFGDYALACKHVIMVDVVMKRLQQVVVLDDIDRHGAARNWRVFGVPSDLAAMFTFAYGHAPRTAAGRTLEPRRLFNLAVVAATFVVGLAWLARRLRWRRAPGHHLMAADGPNIFEGGVLAEIVCDRDLCLFVARTKPVQRQFEALPADQRWPVTSADTGVVLPSELPEMLAVLVTDLRRMLRLGLGGYHPYPFMSMVALVVKRLWFRALFRTHAVKSFWSRDDYNAEHIIRTQELRRLGVRSIGINHGLNVHITVTPHWRYIDFDIYYTFGLAQKTRYFGDRWPAAMQVKPVGMFRLTRAQFARLNGPKTRDIAYFADITDADDMLDVVKRIADAFPDRRVLVKVKPGRESHPLRTRYADAIAQAGNLAMTDENTYDILGRVGYVIGGPTTVVAEGIQAGAAAFCYDAYPAETALLYRDFPDLCVTSAADVVARIRAIEDGSRPFRRDQYAELIELSGRNPFDLIAADLGLPPFLPAVAEAAQ
jgi:hypothetical protein